MRRLPRTFGRPHPKAIIVSDHGYPRFMWKEGGAQCSMMVHHWVWEQKTGEKVPEKHYVVFKNGDKWDWRFSNLELRSPREHAKYPTVRTPKIEEGQKRCGVCGRWKPLKDFGRKKTRSGAGGYHTECRTCHADYAKERREFAGESERERERKRGQRRREKDREAYNAYHREYYRKKLRKKS